MGKQKERPKSWKEFSEAINKNDWEEDWRPPFKVFQWGCEWASYWLSRVALLEVLEYIGKLGILLAAIAYIYPGCDERKQAAEDLTKSKHYVAWQTLNSAVGKSGNAGRVDALMDLNKDGVSLIGLDISNVTFERNLILTNAQLEYAKLDGSQINGSDFSDAIMWNVVLANATCSCVRFRNANLDNANVTNATFIGCDFSSSSLFALNCSNTTFKFCNFVNSHISFSAKATFAGCNFANCNVWTGDGTNILQIRACNIFGITNASTYFSRLLKNNFINYSVPITNHVEWLNRLIRLSAEADKERRPKDLTPEELFYCRFVCTTLSDTNKSN
jgi:uncharacterized protein YjbI with pentapeptide repeats